MKPFNLEETKAGKPLITRDGRKVVFIAHDTDLKLPVVCKVVQTDGTVTLDSYTEEGCWCNGAVSSKDLFMASQKKTVWVNLYKDGISSYHESEEEADRSRGVGVYRLGEKAYPVEIDV